LPLREMIAARRAPLRPLLAKEIREIVAGRALWIMLLLMCPLIGYSFFQAVSLYAESSIAAQQSPVLAASLSPLDGVLVPTFGASYVAVTLLFPFVAIRVLGQEKESGTLRLLVQLPYGTSTLIGAKLAAILAAVVVVSLPALATLAWWTSLGGHLSAPETSNLIAGHVLYGLLVGSIALFAAAVTDSTATAAIVALAFTIGSWVLDFTIAGRPGILEWLARLSLTQILRTFEQGLLSAGVALGVIAAIGGFATLAGIWLSPGVAARVKLARSSICVLATIAVIALVAQIGFARDVTEDRRNSFPAADARALARLSEPLRVSVHLAPEDPRFIDLQRNVLSKLARAMPDVTIRLAAARQPIATSTGDESYGQIEFTYGTRADVTRSTSPREILPLLYALAQVPVPQPDPGGGYPGYPLVADAQATLPFFFGALPLLIAPAWWLSRRPPRRAFAFTTETTNDQP
jgi:ABC-2 type transport system permease protein